MKLTDDQRTILNALREYGEGRGHCCVGELADYLNLTRPRSWVWSYGQVASSLARMEKRGLVVKSRPGLRNEWAAGVMELPSIEQCRTFLATVNRGREAIGLEALEKLDFDSCLPNSPCGCLSATHVFQPAGYNVYEENVRPAFGYKSRPEACMAIGMGHGDHGDRWLLTPDILCVTDVFDKCEDNPALLKALRERMVEAGVV